MKVARFATINLNFCIGPFKVNEIEVETSFWNAINLNFEFRFFEVNEFEFHFFAVNEFELRFLEVNEFKFHFFKVHEFEFHFFKTNEFEFKKLKNNERIQPYS